MPYTNDFIQYSGIHPSGSIRFYSNNGYYGVIAESSSLSFQLFESGALTKQAMFITASGNDAKIGINTTDPKAFLDLRGNTSTEPADLILRTNQDGVITPGEETGRISFLIDSSSFRVGKSKSQFIRSGSSAEIFSRVIETGSRGGSYGSLIFAVNDDNGITDPVEALTIGHNVGSSVDGVSLIISGAVELAHNNPRMRFLDTATGNRAVFIGGKALPNADQGVIELSGGGTKKIELDGGAGNISGSGTLTINQLNLGGGTFTSSSLASAQAGADNLGNHTAIQNLDMATFDITNAGDISGTINGGTF